MGIMGTATENKLTRAVALLDSVSHLNGLVTAYVSGEMLDLLQPVGFIREDEDGDAFAEGAFYDWQREGGDVRVLAERLDLMDEYECWIEAKRAQLLAAGN